MSKNVKNLSEQHTNRLLVSTVISFALLLILLFVHNSQMRGLYLETRTITFVMSIIFAIAGVALVVFAIWKKKNYIFEYAAVSLVVAFCFYGIHGVRFVNAQHMKYGTGILVALYLVGSFIYHTYAPKFVGKK